MKFRGRAFAWHLKGLALMPSIDKTNVFLTVPLPPFSMQGGYRSSNMNAGALLFPHTISILHHARYPYSTSASKDSEQRFTFSRKPGWLYSPSSALPSARMIATWPCRPYGSGILVYIFLKQLNLIFPDLGVVA